MQHQGMQHQGMHYYTLQTWSKLLTKVASFIQLRLHNKRLDKVGSLFTFGQEFLDGSTV